VKTNPYATLHPHARRFRTSAHPIRPHVGQVPGLPPGAAGIPGMPGTPGGVNQPPPAPSPGFGVPPAVIPAKDESTSLALVALAGLAAVGLYLQFSKHPFAFLGAHR